MKTGQLYETILGITNHIKEVGKHLNEVREELRLRGITHDASKLRSPEIEANVVLRQLRKDVKYGTPEYDATLAKFKSEIELHYRLNSHHPQHFPNGVNGMSLLDIVEMLADWKAASDEDPNGDLLRSIEIGRKRFKLSDQLYEIMKNTAKEMGW